VPVRGRCCGVRGTGACSFQNSVPARSLPPAPRASGQTRGWSCHAPRRCHIRQDCSRAAQGRRAGGGGDGGEGATRRRCKLVVARQARWREGRRWREGASLLDVYMVHCVWTWSLTALCVARVPTPGRCKSAEMPTDCCKRACALDPRTGGAHSCTTRCFTPGVPHRGVRAALGLILLYKRVSVSTRPAGGGGLEGVRFL